MKYRSAKGTVINIPDGIDPKQVAAIKADADAGYGTRAQKTADSYGKKAASGSVDYGYGGGLTAEPEPQADTAAPGWDARKEARLNWLMKNRPNDPQVAKLKSLKAGGGVAGGSGVVGPTVSKGTVGKTGTIDPVQASEDVAKAEADDIATNFQLEHPQIITDANGNTREITRHADGTVTVKDTAGGISQTFKDLATAAAQSFNGDEDRKKAEEATYGTLTKYYDRDMARELEDQKQELANRGIPYDPVAAQDPNTKNLYGKTIGAINEKYRGLKDQASQQAVITGNQAYATTSAARDSFLNGVLNGASTFSGNFGPYSNSVTTDSSGDTKDILTMGAGQYMTKYGIDQDTYTKKLAIAKQGSGGGGGKSSGSSDSGGGFDLQ